MLIKNSYICLKKKNPTQWSEKKKDNSNPIVGSVSRFKYTALLICLFSFSGECAQF